MVAGWLFQSMALLRQLVQGYTSRITCASIFSDGDCQAKLLGFALPLSLCTYFPIIGALLYPLLVAASGAVVARFVDVATLRQEQLKQKQKQDS